MISAISPHTPALTSAYPGALQQSNAVANGEQDQEKPKEISSENAADKQLNEEELAQVTQLKQRDAEVKAHEQAHLSAAGSIATSGASFSYQRGPDGIRYAIGGEVSIDTSGIPGDPEATLRKADVIKRAALSPASPSSQDQKVAAQASAMATKAQADLIQMRQEAEDPNAEKESKGSNFNQSA